MLGLRAICALALTLAQVDVSARVLMPEQATEVTSLTQERFTEMQPDTAWGAGEVFMDMPSGAAETLSGKGQLPFRKALVVSINPDHYAAAHERLEAQGVPSEAFWGFNGKNNSELNLALELLRRYNNTDKLHQTLGNFLACMHMSPGTAPHIRAAVVEALRKLVHRTPWNVDDLLRQDRHHCVPKMVAIAATHVRLWERLASGELSGDGQANQTGEVGSGNSTEDDTWYLVMEDDAALCPGWRERMAADLPRLPQDADIVKLFFFGHWRATDQLPNAPDGSPSPFLEARNPMNTFDIAKASAYEIVRMESFEDVPIAGFYAGTQAYLVKPKTARKLLSAIKGKPFQDVDMTMMTSVKHYVWRKVIAMNAPEIDDGRKRSLLQVVPVCNREPPKDWWFR